MGDTFVVPKRVYSDYDEFGHRQLLYAEGVRIGWADALAAGLASGDPASREQVGFMVPHDVYAGDENAGTRHMVYREGTVISLAEAMEYGLVEAEGDDGERKRQVKTPEEAAIKGRTVDDKSAAEADAEQMLAEPQPEATDTEGKPPDAPAEETEQQPEERAEPKRVRTAKPAAPER